MAEGMPILEGRTRPAEVHRTGDGVFGSCSRRAATARSAEWCGVWETRWVELKRNPGGHRQAGRLSEGAWRYLTDLEVQGASEIGPAAALSGIYEPDVAMGRIRDMRIDYDHNKQLLSVQPCFFPERARAAV